MYDDELSFDEEEAFEFLRKLMPTGFAGPDVLAELAPEGWEKSDLARAFHPTLEQAHAETVAMHENLERLRRTEARLERAYQESAEAASKQAPPPIVRAYRNVYGRLPSGWPPA